MKDIPYLTHDLGARNDPKLIELQIDMGGKGLGLYWCIVEMLWENGGYLPAKYKNIAFSLPWATAEDVEHVVTGFGLFEVDGERFWSKAALERIEEKRTKFGKISQARSNAAHARWNRAREEQNAEAEQMDCSCSANAVQNDASNLLTNLHTNKNINNNNAPTALDIFEIFFFKRNFKDPSGETKRFLEHYEGRHWTYQDGTPVSDWTQAAKDWKPLKAGTRWDQEAVNWYRAVWNAARGHIANADMIFLSGLKNIRRDGQKLALRYVNESTARLAAAFICDNSLAGDYQIDFRVSN